MAGLFRLDLIVMLHSKARHAGYVGMMRRGGEGGEEREGRRGIEWRGRGGEHVA